MPKQRGKKLSVGREPPGGGGSSHIPWYNRYNG